MALGGAHLKVAAQRWVPWVMLEETSEGEGLKSSGILIDLMDTMASKLNFTYSVVSPPDGEWGRFLPNGSATGMIGMIMRREVDMALGPFSITDDRYQVVDFSEVIYMDKDGIFLPRPRIQKNLAGFAKPFSWQVWGILAFMLTLSMCLAALVNWLAPGRIHLGREKCVLRPSSLLRAVLIEGIDTLPQVLTGRVLLGAWLLSALILQSAYQGGLTSLLAVPSVRVPIDSLEELVTETRIPYSFESGTNLHQMFQTATSGLFKTVNDNAFQIESLFNERERMKSKRFAIIGATFPMKAVMNEDFSKTGRCNYYIAKKPIWFNSMALAFPKNSSFLLHINKWLIRLVESGVVNRYINAHSSNATLCLLPPGREGGTTTRAFSLKDLGGIFLLLIGGLTIGMVVFVSEKLKGKTALHR